MDDNNCSAKITAKDELPVLRTEIVESQKARMDFLKYKLVAIASLSAIGLGFGDYKLDKIIVPADYVLCIIPFVCAYIDLLCYHNTLRILVIGCFLKHHDDLYEGYIVQLDKQHAKGVRYFFDMEDLALHWSSVALSIALIVYCIVPFFTQNNPQKGWIFLIAGIIALGISNKTKLSFQKHQDALFDTAKKLKSEKGTS